MRNLMKQLSAFQASTLKLISRYCKIGQSNCNYLLTQMKNQIQAYFHEAKWLHQKYIPRVDEYLRVALVSPGYPLLATTSLVGMGDTVTKDSFEWFDCTPKVVRASAVIARLMDDIVSHKVFIRCFLHKNRLVLHVNSNGLFQVFKLLLF